jgi:hypothetical protein
MTSGLSQVRVSLAPQIAFARQHAVPIGAGVGCFTVGWFSGSHYQLRKHNAQLRKDVKYHK